MQVTVATNQGVSETLASLSQFNTKWGEHWPFIAEHRLISACDRQFVRDQLPQILAAEADPRAAINSFLQDFHPDITDNPNQLAAYLALLTYLALGFRRPYIEKDPEKLAATPIVSEQSIQFPEKLSTLWTVVANRLGIEASTSLTALVYCNFSCNLSDLPIYTDPLEELHNIDRLILHQRTRLAQSAMQFCNHENVQHRQMYCEFLKIFLYSEIVGRRICAWAETALNAFVTHQSPERVADCLAVMIRWSIEALTQHLEANQDIPKEALAIAQFTPAIKLSERKSTPGVTGFLVPFLDEFFGFTSESSPYLEKVRASRSFLLPELAAILESCQTHAPFDTICAQMPPAQKAQLESLKLTLWEVMKEWRIFHRNQVGRFLAKGVESQHTTPKLKTFLRNFIQNMNERMRAFEAEQKSEAYSLNYGSQGKAHEADHL